MAEKIKPELLVMMCDLYRRAGDLEKAAKAANAVLANKSLPQRMAELQLKLCREKKTDRHTLGEVPEHGTDMVVIFLREER